MIFFLGYVFFNFIKISVSSVIRGESNWIVFELVNLPVIVAVICPFHVIVGLERILIFPPHQWTYSAHIFNLASPIHSSILRNIHPCESGNLAHRKSQKTATTVMFFFGEVKGDLVL